MMRPATPPADLSYRSNSFRFVPPVFGGHASLAILLVTLCASMALAQVAPATRASGTVTDSTGAVVAGAKAILVNADTGFTKQVSTGGNGRFVFDMVPPGNYELQVQAQGFATFHQSGIKLDVDVPADLSVKLSVSSTTQQVNVTADAPLVDTESGTLREVVSEKYITDLPLNGRNAAALVYMAPGTVQGKGTDTAPYASTSDTIAVSVNGTYGNQVAYKLDGATHEDSITNLNATFPNPDALAEFSVQTNNFDARYGGSAGAVVNIVTKSGSNAFHGSAFEYLRNGALNAKNYFATQADGLKRNQFGGSLGGPILKNKLFFFGSYQGTTIANTSFANTAFVPTAAERQGDFSSVSKQLVNPFTKKPIAGNQVPVSSFASALFGKVPTSSDPAGKLLYAVPTEIRNHQVLGKLDSNFGKHQLSGSYFYVHYGDPGWDGGQTLLNYKIGQLQTTNEYKVSDTWTITQQLLNSVTFSALMLDSTQTRTAPFSIFDFANLKVAKPATQFLETGLTITGFSGWGTGGSQPPGEWTRSNYEISDVLTWVHGKHTSYMGATYTPHTKFDSTTGFQEEPIFKFDGSGSGNALVDLMYGYASSFTQTAGKAKFTRGNQINAFFQDVWRVGPRLSLDLGLRWEPFLPYDDPVQHQVGGYIPGFHSQRFPNAPAGLVFAGDQGFPDAGMFADVNNFSPRVGFSYAARQGAHPLTVRGGWGMFYIMPFMKLYNNFVQNAPFSPSATLFGVNILDPYGSAGVTNPFPPFAPVNANASSTFALPIAYQYFNTHWHLGHTNAYNLTIEQQLTPDTVFRVAYVGSQGDQLQYFDERNPAIYKTGAKTSDTNARRPLAPTFASLVEMTNGGVSNYNALQLTLDKHLGKHLALVTNYTYSKSLDNQSVDNQFTVSNPDPFNPNFNYGRSDFDTPHNLSVWGIWNSPALKNSGWLLRNVAGGWEVTGAMAWRSGTPFTITSGQDRSLSGVGQDRADLIGNPNLGSGRSNAELIAQYFNTGAFALAAPGTFGNAGRNILRNPRYYNMDSSLGKYFGGERHKVQFRADFFNLFNNVHFNQPGSNFSAGSTFGKITSAGEPRILQLALRYEF